MDCLSFDPLSFQQDCLTASEVDIGGCQVVQALMISLMIVMLDEAFDGGFQITGQIVMF
jgi:hypothetical protein